MGWAIDKFWKLKSDELLKRFEDDPEQDFSDRELEQIATAMLMRGREEVGGSDNESITWLNPGQEYHRHRREIVNASGVAEALTGLEDSAVKRKNPGQSPTYWRSHPEGRKVNSKEARKKGAGFYR